MSNKIYEIIPYQITNKTLPANYKKKYNYSLILQF